MTKILVGSGRVVSLIWSVVGRFRFVLYFQKKRSGSVSNQAQPKKRRKTEPDPDDDDDVIVVGETRYIKNKNGKTIKQTSRVSHVLNVLNHLHIHFTKKYFFFIMK